MAVEPATKRAYAYFDGQNLYRNAKLAFGYTYPNYDPLLLARAIAAQADRWIKIACAFPASLTYANKRGINRTDWLPIGKAEYDACIDPADYR